MKRDERWTVGSSWVDNLLPVAIGLLCALSVIRKAGPIWTVLVVPGLCWIVWQSALRLGVPLMVRVVLGASVAVGIAVFWLLFFGVDIDQVFWAVADAGIKVNGVADDRSAIVVSIPPVSWGPERNVALRAIFIAAHTHARVKRQVRIQWGDAMSTTINMSDIEAFVAGKITYQEILNRMDWSGSPDILPEDSVDGPADRRPIQTVRTG